MLVTIDTDDAAQIARLVAYYEDAVDASVEAMRTALLLIGAES